MSDHLTHRRNSIILTFISLVLIAGLIAGCGGGINFPGLGEKTPVEPPVEPDAKSPLATITFEVMIPTTSPSESVTLEILDEVTSLALNPKRYVMSPAGDYQYKIDIPIALGSLVKYRYIRTGETSTAIEYTAGGQQVRYRLFQVDGPSMVQDTVAGWTDLPYTGPAGRITGQVIDKESNAPIPSALIVAGGAQTLTASDGSFVLEGLSPGTHNLVAVSLDGLFFAFQQGATVSEGATTPAAIFVSKAPLVKITFVAQIPAGEIKGLPLRLVGSTYALGNMFADLDGGFSILASRAPVMPTIADDIYSLTLDLPVGLDLRYKYTLGDGFWNAEHAVDGGFRTRQLIVPEVDTTVTDIIDSWKTGSRAPISFTVTVPTDTPAEDTVSIQFNPFSWTVPIPMWPLGNNTWLYVLNGPLEFFSELQYRYCRNDQCGVADDSATHAIGTPGKSITLTGEGQSIQDVVTAWANLSPVSVSSTIVAPEISPIGDRFVAGVEFSPNYNPLWQRRLAAGLTNIQALGANWVLLSPSWSYTDAAPLAIETVAGRDELWMDTTAAVQTATQLGLKTAIFPRLQTDFLPGGLWNEPITDGGWWTNWFNRYRTFVLHHADLAQQTQAGMLILGGPDVTPALPGGLLTNGESSGVPENAGEMWQGILTDVRARYSGPIGWTLPYPNNATPLPEWLGEVDVIYVLFNAALTGSSEPTQGELEGILGQLLDSDILPIADQYGKSILLGLEYPSAKGAASGCVQLTDRCLPFDLLNQPIPELPEIQLDLQEQLDIYNAVMNTIAARPWINGVVSRGYYPPAALQDTSPSIHGKPAADVLWYWYPRILGK